MTLPGDRDLSPRNTLNRSFAQDLLMTAGVPVLVFCLSLVATAGASELAIVNVNVVTMQDEKILRGQTVIVNAGHIQLIGPVSDTAVPEGAELVDGTDRYLMPGLCEMHGHVPGASSAELQRVLTLGNRKQPANSRRYASGQIPESIATG